jgi:hypothetical protein
MVSMRTLRWCMCLVDLVEPNGDMPKQSLLDDCANVKVQRGYVATLLGW